MVNLVNLVTWKDSLQINTDTLMGLTLEFQVISVTAS